MANSAFHAVHAAETGVLELGNFATARNGWFAAGDQRSVDHTFNNDRTSRVIRARFSAKPEELDAGRVDVVLIDQADDRICSHRIYAVIGAAYAETAPHNLANLRPLVIRPVTPILQPYAVWWDIGGEAANSDGFSGFMVGHDGFRFSPAILVAQALSLNTLFHRDGNPGRTEGRIVGDVQVVSEQQLQRVFAGFERDF